MINQLKMDINGYDELTNKRVQLEYNKLIFDATDRDNQLEEQIRETSASLKVMAKKIQGGAKNLVDYENECNYLNFFLKINFSNLRSTHSQYDQRYTDS
jgi:predicted  nucleic acid-binding Zn-ribbon protein